MIHSYDIAVPYDFTARVKSRGKGERVSAVKEKGLFKASIPDVWNEDAPVALKWDFVDARDVPQKVCLRYFRDAFYARSGTITGEDRIWPTPRVLKRHDLPTERRTWQQSHLTFQGSVTTGVVDRYLRKEIPAWLPEPPDHPREIVSSDEAAVRRSLSETAERMLILHGDEVWLRVGEPRFIVVAYKRYAAAELHVGATRYGAEIDSKFSSRLGTPVFHRFFGIDEVDAMDAYLAEKGLVRGYDLGNGFANMVREIPEAFVTDWALNEKERLVDGFVTEFSADIGDRRSAEVAQWMAVRQQLADFRSTSDPASLDLAIEESIPEFIGLIGPGDPRLEEIEASLALYADRGNRPDRRALFAAGA